MKGKKGWRLSRTLKRNVEVRPIEQEDVKYAWGAYRVGALNPMGTPFDDSGMDAVEFKTEFEKYVLSNATAAWTVIANTKIGRVPIGFVLGGHAPLGAYIIRIGNVWFPWASKRNVVEGTVAFFNRVRKEHSLMSFAGDDDKKLHEIACQHGVVRRVGTSMLTGKPIPVFEGIH